jgi:hypothetical protein
MGQAALQDPAIVLRDNPLGLGRHDVLVGEADQPGWPEPPHFAGDPVGDEVAALLVLDVDRHRRPIHQHLQPLFDRLAMGFVREFEPALTERVRHGDQQLPGPERLDQITVRPQFEGPLGDLRVVDPGDQDDRGTRMVASNLLDQDQPGLARHLASRCRRGRVERNWRPASRERSRRSPRTRTHSALPACDRPTAGFRRGRRSRGPGPTSATRRPSCRPYRAGPAPPGAVRGR